MEDRRDLILSLAGAMGMSGEKDNDKKSFDKETGTFYCGSHIYQPSDITAAKMFLKKNSERLSSLNDRSSSFYEIAISAIELVEKEFLCSSGGKMIIRETKAV